MRCNICGGTGFDDMPKRPAVRCRTCGSLERGRVAALYLNGSDRPKRGAAVLHFAPERGLSGLLAEAAGPGYRAVDIDPSLYPHVAAERFDLCRDLDTLGEGRFDLIVHNHVLEHIECNYTVVLARLVKALKPDGLMLFSLPILPGGFGDELLDGDHDAKLARFGPSLHVRRFGTATLQQTLGMVVRIPERYDLTALFPETQLADANIPAHHWRAFTGASVFRVGRRDLLI
ncbi:methyltransferase domain-containing protein [Lichenihabitans sp. Uapishka_5]|uniref:class I SAM-dependent methyltransferase n=1 Tax=Lichenihabitans sp. Uapishka_5 TaxID=3037302 RepID=UPI0029E7F175|nr:methyltransferase domain-containing protein [Lichenihabitans sp. Uapishka_5]MDX7951395.1 methyltransferase domain-containing protein [Lichenihabitans sp. Uapishka_5]